ncbi:peptidase T [Rhizobium sp. 1399]|uniref:peptidase T n=1 Tax=Rhizobium sp. 1399 TaxID=2817758 RepID=UPI002864C2F9|nr:peptidase T [Rhizobium sp. 1399]MDR6670190.1 tripeptide aminopeptidase [Rhizobium sp. 1399]
MSRRGELIERFFRYVAIESQSDARSDVLPSSPGQLKLACLLAEELKGLGVDDVLIDDQAIVTAVKRGTRPGAPKIGFIAHLDTVDVGLSPDIKPQIVSFDGADICLNLDRDIWLRVEEHPEILPWTGHDIILSDGTSVLGADNKAAIAVIMTLLAGLRPGDAHGDIFVAFVPDEEIGLRGAKALDLSHFACDFAYTIDCCELGELVLENFNAASGEILFTGVSAHPMSAKGMLVNPLLMALDFIAHFDRRDTPECTDERDGFFWFKELRANDSEARLSVMIRDFDDVEFERRKAKIHSVAERVKAGHPGGGIESRVTDTYRNIAGHLAADTRPASLLIRAFEKVGVEPKHIAMRGGTDGAVLSARGIPTPNFFTGAHNFHSRYEFLPVPAFEKSLAVAWAICALAAEEASWAPIASS